MSPTPLQLTVNGDAVTVPSGATVRDLLAQLSLPLTTAVERNRVLIPRARHAETALEDGDVLELVQLVGGG